MFFSIHKLNLSDFRPITFSVNVLSLIIYDCVTVSFHPNICYRLFLAFCQCDVSEYIILNNPYLVVLLIGVQWRGNFLVTNYANY